MSDRPRPASGASPLQPRTPEFPYWRASQATPSSDGLQGVYPAYHALDDRASSAVSLRPSISEEAETRRRILLMIYIHGYMGNDASFHSFPAHVHNLLKRTLAHTHVVHTKIYPRYKTYKAMDIARDNFSAWLQPHESSTTDVILVGHSMGGLLAAEAVLIVRSPLLPLFRLTLLLSHVHFYCNLSGDSSRLRPRNVRRLKPHLLHAVY